MVLLEAMAAGLPIVSFAVGGVSAMLTSESALLVSTGDVAGLTRALTFALTCKTASEARAAAARRIFEQRYTTSQCASHLLEIYGRVIRAQYVPRDVDAMAARWSQLSPVASLHRSASM